MRPVEEGAMAARVTRRKFFRQALAGAAGAWALDDGLADQPARRLRVAAIYTVLHFRSHAFNFLENFLRPYLFNGRRTEAGMDVVALYADQTAADGDLTTAVSRQFHISVYRTIGEALCGGGRELAVDAILAIGEHGRYPVNRLGQVEYPRKRFFDEAVAVMRRSRRFVPLFNDKHLSYRWDWARQMYDTARQLDMPLMAGSSVPLAQRRPALELPAGAAIEEAVAIHGGGAESYDFHGLEILQALVESRRGGESGVSQVEFLRGDAWWEAGRRGRWSVPLAEAALAAQLGRPADLRRLTTDGGSAPHGLLLTYRDGLRAAVLKVGQSSTRWCFACRLAGQRRPVATSFYTGPWGNRNLFAALSHAVQHFFRRRRPPYPVERTLLTTGVLEAAMRSRAEGGRALATPHLHLAYPAADFRPFREMGASWQILTERAPEPRELGTAPSVASP
jgi:hypothetical protein